MMRGSRSSSRVELLRQMQRHHAERLRRVERLPFARPATRVHVYRSIALATDFLHTHYAQDIDLDAIAEAAGISKFHFTRLFTLVHGIAPHAYLQRKRVRAAMRLLQSSTFTIHEVAAAVGFRERTTLLRQMRRSGRRTPREVRRMGARSSMPALDPLEPAESS